MAQASSSHTSQPRTDTAVTTSAVKALISWIVATDREYRVAQAMVNETRNRD